MEKCANTCLRICKWFPVIFITAVIAWSYYAYVIQLCFFTIEQIAKRWIFLTFYHFFLGMLMWSYYKTIFTEGEMPPKEFFLSEYDIYQLNLSESDTNTRVILDKYSKTLPLLNRTHNGGIRYCEKCKCVKPDRAHHCSICNKCILKMDHHCPWVNNCVGFSNYKFFCLFLNYAMMYCLYVAATSLEYFIKFWGALQTFEASRFHLLFLFFISIMFSISLSSLFFYHFYLTIKNRSTLESFRGPIFISGVDKNGFNLGCMENVKQVFGDNIIKALLPIQTSQVDGVAFPSKYRAHSSNLLSNEASHFDQTYLINTHVHNQNNNNINNLNNNNNNQASNLSSDSNFNMNELETRRILPNELSMRLVPNEDSYANSVNSLKSIASADE